MQNTNENMKWFIDARYGMFVHFGLYSMLGRGEWVMNRERISPEEYRKLADNFNPEKFNADDICQLAVDGGMKYIVFTTMHHEGFRMYDSDLSDFCSTKTTAKRDFVAEIISAARKHGLKIGLYHSLNNWYDKPDGVDALEDKGKYEIFIKNTFARIKELLTKYKPIDTLWYDGWWPFNAEGWQAEEMNEMARSIQADIIINGRNGLPGDFATPEQHLTAPSPWRPWEACITLNDHWGYYPGDNNWKAPVEIIKTLLACGRGNGNLLLNIGPDGNGVVPEKSIEIIQKVGQWIKNGGSEAITANDALPFSPTMREEGDRGDWNAHAVFTATDKNLFATFLYSPQKEWIINGLECKVLSVSQQGKAMEFSNEDDCLKVTLPAGFENEFCPVLKIECDQAPSIYRTAGMRLPQVEHPRYDPCEPDIQYD